VGPTKRSRNAPSAERSRGRFVESPTRRCAVPTGSTRWLPRGGSRAPSARPRRGPPYPPHEHRRVDRVALVLSGPTPSPNFPRRSRPPRCRSPRVRRSPRSRRDRTARCEAGRRIESEGVLRVNTPRARRLDRGPRRSRRSPARPAPRGSHAPVGGDWEVVVVGFGLAANVVKRRLEPVHHVLEIGDGPHRDFGVEVGL